MTTMVLALVLILVLGAATGGRSGVISSRRRLRPRLERLCVDEHGHVQPARPAAESDAKGAR
jgi:hypothetical protein